MINLFRLPDNLASVKLYFFLISAFALIPITSIIPAYAQILPQNSYVIEGKGFTSSQNYVEDSNFKLNILTNHQVNDKVPLVIQNGTFSISGYDYAILGSWSSNIVRDGRFIILSGDAQSQNGDIIHLNLFGRLIQDVQSGAIYQITGKATGSESLKILYSTKVSTPNIPVSQEIPTIQTPSTPSPAMPPTAPQTTIPPSVSTTPTANGTITTNIPGQKQKIMVIVFQTDRVYSQHNYLIEAKVFYATKNPTRDFNHKTGVVSNAAITVQIFDSTGALIKTLSGLTNQQGYYTDSFMIPYNVQPGTYTTVITAQFDNSSDSQKLPLNVLPFR